MRRNSNIPNPGVFYIPAPKSIVDVICEDIITVDYETQVCEIFDLPSSPGEYRKCFGITCPVCSKQIEYVVAFSNKEYILTCADQPSELTPWSHTQPHHYQFVIMKDGSNYREYFQHGCVTVSRHSPSNITMIQFMGGKRKPVYKDHLISNERAMHFIRHYGKWMLMT